MIGLAIPILAGLGGVQALRPFTASLSAEESWGLGLITGLGAVTGVLAILGMAGVPLSAPLAFALAVAAVVGGWFAGRRSPFPHFRGRLDPASAIVAVLLLFIVIVAAVRADFYPVSAMDAHAYDGRARRIVAEGSLRGSTPLVVATDGRSNMTYPPLYPLSLALVEWGGGAEGKLVDIAWLVGLLLVTGGFVARRSGAPLAGWAAAFLVAAAPEFWRHASLGLTNLATTAALAPATLMTAERLMPHHTPHASATPAAASRRAIPWLLAGSLFAIATALRIESALFALAVGLVVFLRHRHPIGAALLAAPALVVAAAWEITLFAWYGSTNGAALRTSVLPDPALLLKTFGAAGASLAQPGLYGWCFAVAVAGLALFVLSGGARRSVGRFLPVLLVLFLAECAALAWVYQQIDPSFGGGTGSYFANSLKRALFVLMPTAVVIGLLPIAAWRRDA